MGRGVLPGGRTASTFARAPLAYRDCFGPPGYAPPMTDDRPPDLVSVREAARLVDRSPATIRAWVRAGDLRVWRGEGTHEANRPALVSRAELLHLAGVTKAPNPPRPGGAARPEPPADGGELDALRAQLDALRVQLDAARAVADARGETADALRSTVGALEARARDLAADLERERARADAAERERDALRAAQGLPWWRRLLAPALPGPGGGGET